MEQLANHIKATAGNHLAYTHYHELGLTAAQVKLDSDSFSGESSERIDRILNAYLAIWGGASDGTLTAPLACEMLRVLNGDVDPEEADLPRPNLSDFHRADRRDPNPELRDAVKELLNTVVECERTARDSELEAKRQNAREEAEYIWKAFLRGEAIDTDDLLTLQRTGLL